MSPFGKPQGVGGGRRLAGLGATLLRWLTGSDPPPRRSQTLPSVETLEGRELLSLTLVSRRASYPFTSIVHLRATYPDGKTYVGSGAMVDQFHVLTAGHMIYSYLDGGFARKIVATPKMYGNSKPYGTANMTYERTYTTWINYNRTHPDSTSYTSMDIALITLNRRVGRRTGWMSFGYDNDPSTFSSGTILNTAGYPGTSSGYSGKHMYFSAGPIAGLSSTGSAICYYHSSITTYKGQSGSPLWMYDSSDNSRIIYGVIAGGSTYPYSLNFSTRITQGIFNDLQAWRTSDTPPRKLGMGGVMRMASAGPVPDHYSPLHRAIQTHVHLAAPLHPAPRHVVDTHTLRPVT